MPLSQAVIMAKHRVHMIKKKSRKVRDVFTTSRGGSNNLNAIAIYTAFASLGNV